MALVLKVWATENSSTLSSAGIFALRPVTGAGYSRMYWFTSIGGLPQPLRNATRRAASRPRSQGRILDRPGWGRSEGRGVHQKSVMAFIHSTFSWGACRTRGPRGDHTLSEA